MSSRFWCRRAWVAGAVVESVRLEADDAGVLTRVQPGVPARPGDTSLPGVVHPGMVNAHSHAFHRSLRGRTHRGRGSFWTWRDQMYAEADRLDPPGYEDLATRVFAEMVVSGYTAVGEFHYLHHQPDGRPYDEAHALELALARAARRTGIRLVLLDTCYLAGGFGRPLSGVQRRFGDGDARGWLGRWSALREVLAERAPEVHLGAAIHSVRAVPEADLAVIADDLDPQAVLHTHLSEQPAENEACLDHTGATPAGLLDRYGLLASRTSVVHATHLTARDVELVGGARAAAVLCPTTEADLADGIGPARELADAGATIAVGSDQHAVIDPLLELRALEHGERLRTGERGRFTPADLVGIGAAGGARSLGLDARGIAVGAPCDLVAVADTSVRTRGCDPDQLVLAATGSDVDVVVVGGRIRARAGVHVDLGDPAALWSRAAGAVA